MRGPDRPPIRSYPIHPLGRNAALGRDASLLLHKLNELGEETGLFLQGGQLSKLGFINSDHQDVSSVHFGVVYAVKLDLLPQTADQILTTVSAQAEPERACWVPTTELASMFQPGLAPQGGTFEDWSQIVVKGVFADQPQPL